MSFDAIPEDREENYPCECGGRIDKFEGKWSCDSCDFEVQVEMRAGEALRKISLPNQFEKELSEMIGEHTKRGLKKIDCVRKLEWVLGNVKMS